MMLKSGVLMSMVVLALSVLGTYAFSPLPRVLKVQGLRRHGSQLAMAAPPGTKHTLVLIRHGESTWNQENK